MFKVGGVSSHNGRTKVRFANDMTRVKVLVKGGHTDVVLMTLPRAMSKLEVAQYIKSTDLYQNPLYTEAVDTAIAKYSGEDAVKVKAKVKAKAKDEPSLEALVQRAVDFVESAAQQQEAAM
jgi:hypothetical protein